jgi:hypothetical protein
MQRRRVALLAHPTAARADARLDVEIQRVSPDCIFRLMTEKQTMSAVIRLDEVVLAD